MVPEVVLELVEDLKRKYTISTICDCIGVPRATYYRWKKRGACKPSELELQIKEICEKHKFRIGHTSRAFQSLAKEKGIITSMSRKGNCLDNAVIESFHSTLKSEEFYSQPREYLTNPIVVEKVKNFIQYYNQIRLMAKLNYLSPIEYREQVA